MNVIFIGDSPTVSTGFSRCTRAACDALHAAGHTVRVLGMSEFGGPNDFPYEIHPCVHPFDSSRNASGVDRLPVFIDRYRPDVVVILQDPFNIKPYFDALDQFFKDATDITLPPVVGWLACDSLNYYAKPLNRLAHVAVWTKFGGDVLVEGGYEGPWSIVPLGVNVDTFYPRDRAESRAKVGIDTDKFVVGVVGRNQPRKRIDASIQYFAEWVHTYSITDATLLLHVAPTGEHGCNIRALVRHYKLRDMVVLSEPRAGRGVDNALMPFLYSSLDAYMSTSQAEGWGLPAHEAMACGVPCVLPDFAAFGPDGWVGDAALRVPCTSNALTAPMNAQPYTIGAIPDRKATVDALRYLYAHPAHREPYRERGLALAKTLTWERTGREMVQLLERIVAESRERRSSADSRAGRDCVIPAESVDSAP